MLIWKRIGKVINGEIAFGFFCSALFWLAVLGWATSYAPDPEKEKACYQAAAKTGHNTEQCKTLWERTTTDPVALFTLVLSIATVGLWVATLDGIRRQSNETKILQRAYLGTELRGLRDMNRNVIAHVAFVNRGNLPARKIRNAVKIGWSSDGDKKEFEKIEVLDPGTIILLPKTQTERGTGALSPSDLAQSQTNTGFVYVWGRIEYDDGFGGKPRWLIYCHRYNLGSPKAGRLHHHHINGD